ncbi:unnamed protein product [Medioppia subpectinata]|uniref:Peptidase M13 C-terminal domain-containing protein n=1 Tax=Medioppia subpectinata TaxID=1979941 RepID=A0A7R9LCS5_9ACAR|nr:unnamed protein product [Medioppia subpectinata]CAG2117748.1 unnamed protein product [Medioppia subpectinata]
MDLMTRVCQFDLKGDLINWWSEDIRQRFEQKAYCFISEYSSIYVPEVNMNLNGKNTVGENIADNGGMRESYRAFQLYVKRHGEPNDCHMLANIRSNCCIL